MTVLSLFDGMSCGQIALMLLNIPVDKYYASEIDKHAIAQTQLNFPKTIQLGDVVDIDVTKLDPIDLIIGGSPCQSFSFAGKRAGMSTIENEDIYTLERYLELKESGFQFEGESYLFWEYMRILTDVRKYNPNVKFLLENVEMGSKWERVLSEALGIYGVHINSALVSAQNRKRIYWTNIRVKQVGLFGELHSDIPQPADRGILLKDILEENVDEKYYLSEKALAYLNRTEINKRFAQSSDNEKSNCLTANFCKGVPYNVLLDTQDPICIAQRGRENGQNLEPNFTGKTNCLTSVQKDNLVMQLKRINDRVDDVSFNEEGIRPYRNDEKKSGIQELGTIAMEDTKTSCLTTGHQPKCIVIPEATSKGYVEINPGECFDYENPKSKTRRGRKMDDKSNSLMAQNMSFMNYTKDMRIRRLTPTECARLQTVPDSYKWTCPETQQYKLLGNGWTILVICHILQYLTN